MVVSGLLGLLVGYLVVLMYVQGVSVRHHDALIFEALLACVYFRKMVGLRAKLRLPGPRGMGLFILYSRWCVVHHRHRSTLTTAAPTSSPLNAQQRSALMDRCLSGGKKPIASVARGRRRWQRPLTDGETGKHYLSQRVSASAANKGNYEAERDRCPAGGETPICG